MGLVEKQWEFLQDVAKLIEYAKGLGFIVTAGEMYRPIEMQRLYIETGRSKTMNSKHLSRLAVDLNFFIRDKKGRLQLTWSREKIKPLGEFWEELNPKNRWGGSWRGLIEAGKSKFVDVPHFERAS